MIKHYRVDKMLHIRMSDEEREGKEHFSGLDMAAYTRKSFGMFGGPGGAGSSCWCTTGWPG